jgi:2-haloacid dehalogenase
LRHDKERIVRIKAVVFDAYGTLFDVYSIQALADDLYPTMGADIAVKWRDKQIEYTRLITQSDPHNPSGSQYFRPFWEITRLSLEYTLDRLTLNRSAGQVEQLMEQYARLTPFPENLAVLQKIKSLGLTTAILSNGSVDMLVSAVKNAGMVSVLDHLISVDPVRLFKTSPESYGLVQQTIPVNKNEVLFVSSNAWDALGATWFGFTTHWVNRQGLPFEALSPQPHFSGSDLNSVLDSLGKKTDSNFLDTIVRPIAVNC